MLRRASPVQPKCALTAAVERWLHQAAGPSSIWPVYLMATVVQETSVSLLYNRPVTELMAERLPSTLLLTVTAFAISLLLAVIIGTYAARYRTLCDRVVNIVIAGPLARFGSAFFW